MPRSLLLILILIPALSYSQLYSLQYVDTKTDASFRGLSVADDNAIWVSGTKGWAGHHENNTLRNPT